MWAWKLFRSTRAETSGDFPKAIRLLDEAAKIKPLHAPERVQRAMLLLKEKRTREAHIDFAALRSEFKASDDPDLMYLRHYCTTMLSLLNPSSGQWSYEARQAKGINCRGSLKRRFSMITIDEIFESISPRR